jgi:hypothetical protein
MNLNNSQQLDIEKRKLEASIIVDLKAVFKNMANDAANIYQATETLPNQLLADNYSPEFLKGVRDAMRKSIKRFGFNLRKDVEKKHNLFFDAEHKANFFDLELKETIIVEDIQLAPKLNEINSQFLLDSTIFIANESEAQNDYITETNSKMLEQAAIAGMFAYSSLVADKQREVQEISIQEPSPKINRQRERAERQLNELNATKTAIIAESIRQSVIQKSVARSELIASQNVGLAESWARQREAELIDEAELVGVGGNIVKPQKTWRAILDSKTRSSHAEADSQEIGVNDLYNVGGEQLRMPRDPNGSAGNTINCRCNSEFSV